MKLQKGNYWTPHSNYLSVYGLERFEVDRSLLPENMRFKLRNSSKLKLNELMEDGIFLTDNSVAIIDCLSNGDVGMFRNSDITINNYCDGLIRLYDDSSADITIDFD